MLSFISRMKSRDRGRHYSDIFHRDGRERHGISYARLPLSRLADTLVPILPTRTIRRVSHCGFARNVRPRARFDCQKDAPEAQPDELLPAVSRLHNRLQIKRHIWQVTRKLCMSVATS
jgi:hypothetical protein